MGVKQNAAFSEFPSQSPHSVSGGCRVFRETAVFISCTWGQEQARKTWGLRRIEVLFNDCPHGTRSASANRDNATAGPAKATFSNAFWGLEPMCRAVTWWVVALWELELLGTCCFLWGHSSVTSEAQSQAHPGVLRPIDLSKAALKGLNKRFYEFCNQYVSN